MLANIPDAVLCFDLCELTGYEYHTGIVFAAYTHEHGRAVAKGGRYDDIGEVFGRARPASGFDCDLKTLAKLTQKTIKTKAAIVAPADADLALAELIESLRQSGEIVIVSFSNDTFTAVELAELNCDRQIVLENDSWVVKAID